MVYWFSLHGYLFFISFQSYPFNFYWCCYFFWVLLSFLIHYVLFNLYFGITLRKMLKCIITLVKETTNIKKEK